MAPKKDTPPKSKAATKSKARPRSQRRPEGLPLKAIKAETTGLLRDGICPLVAKLGNPADAAVLDEHADELGNALEAAARSNVAFHRRLAAAQKTGGYTALIVVGLKIVMGLWANHPPRPKKPKPAPKRPSQPGAPNGLVDPNRETALKVEGPRPIIPNPVKV